MQARLLYFYQINKVTALSQQAPAAGYNLATTTAAGRQTTASFVAVSLAQCARTAATWMLYIVCCVVLAKHYIIKRTRFVIPKLLQNPISGV